MRFAVVGGGVVGISIALAILERQLGSVTIFDKERALGLHASTRNSGVIHSGIYYSGDSLKAKFSVLGNEEIKKLCRDNNLKLMETGKLILSQNDESEKYLSILESRAVANHVNFERLGKHQLSDFAPGAKTHESFLRVKSTAIADPKEVLLALQAKFIALGGKINLLSKVNTSISSNGNQIEINRQNFDHIVNAAGAGALELANEFGAGKGYLVTPFLGIYWGVERSVLPLDIPLYPTPHPINPFLGVHLTPTSYGFTKIGPTAIPVLGKEQYSWREGFSAKDATESIRAFFRIAIGKSHSLTQILKSEVPKFFVRRMLDESALLFPEVRTVSGWKAMPAGIRAQLVDNRGTLVQDFVVEKAKNSTHVLNAVSPGWTSAIPFGRWVVEEYLAD